MSDSQALKVALVQTDPVWQAPADNRVNIAGALQKQITNCDLIVLPEMFTAGFGADPKRFAESSDGPTLQWLKTIARQHTAAVCGSYGVLSGELTANRLLWVTPDEQHYYDKRHLFRMMGEHERYTSGNQRLLVNWQGWRINPQICYDLRFPVWCRNRNDFDLQIFVANWPAARRDHWLSLLKARAIENQSYVIGVNRTGLDGKQLRYSGDSVVFDPLGKVILDAGEVAGIYQCQLDLNTVKHYREKFPAWMDADSFSI